MQRANGKLLPILLLAAAGGGADRAEAQAAAASLRITLDADAVEIVRAWRRSHGLDPPDAQADARVAALLQRMNGVAANEPASPVPRPAPVLSAAHSAGTAASAVSGAAAPASAAAGRRAQPFDDARP